MSTAAAAASDARGRLLFLTGGFRLGGTETHRSLVLPRLKRRGWRVHVRLLGPDGPLSGPAREAGVDLRAVSTQSALARVPKLRALASMLEQARVVRREIVVLEPCVVHCFLPAPCIIGWLALAGGRRVERWLVMSRRSQNVRPQSFAGEKRLERMALRSADLVLGHSGAVVAELAAEGVRSPRLLANGIETSAYTSPGRRDPARRARGWADAEVVIVCVANLIPYKGHVELLSALGRMRGDLPPWRLLLVGEGEVNYVSRLHALASAAGVESRIEFAGARTDLAEWLEACDLGVLASHHEGFSNALVEYMAACLPVVTTAVGGNLDAVVDGATGMLVPAGDVDALAAALACLVTDPHRRQAMGTAGRRRAVAEFDVARAVRDYERVYEELGCA